jgi:hypothetical protein
MAVATPTPAPVVRNALRELLSPAGTSVITALRRSTGRRGDNSFLLKELVTDVPAFSKTGSR